MRSWKSTARAAARPTAAPHRRTPPGDRGEGAASRAGVCRRRCRPANTLPTSNSRTRDCWRATLRASAATRPGSSCVRITPSSALSGLANGTRALRCAATCSSKRGIDEGVVDRLQIIARGELADAASASSTAVSPGVGHARGAARQGGRDRVVAVDARDLLDQVFLDREVEAARRRRHPPAVRRHRRRRGQAHAGCARPRRRRCARPSTRASRARRSAIAAWLRQVLRQYRFDHRAGRAAGDLDDQPGRDFDRDARQFRIDAALEAMRGIGMQAELAAATDDRGRREVRGFEEHVARRVGDARVEPAHDPGRARRRGRHR